MDNIRQFFAAFETAQTAILATSSGASVTMRTISPVVHQGKILFFTSRNPVKFQQLEANPHCCIAAGNAFAEASAEFCGSTMRDENAELRKVYCGKFPDAFDAGVTFGGREADFILLTPVHLKGWAFENDSPAADGIPTVPFDLVL